MVKHHPLNAKFRLTFGLDIPGRYDWTCTVLCRNVHKRAGSVQLDDWLRVEERLAYAQRCKHHTRKEPRKNRINGHENNPRIRNQRRTRVPIDNLIAPLSPILLLFEWVRARARTRRAGNASGDAAHDTRNIPVFESAFVARLLEERPYRVYDRARAGQEVRVRVWLERVALVPFYLQMSRVMTIG